MAHPIFNQWLALKCFIPGNEAFCVCFICGISCKKKSPWQAKCFTVWYPPFNEGQNLRIPRPKWIWPQNHFFKKWYETPAGESRNQFSRLYTKGCDWTIRFRLSNFMKHTYDVISLHFPKVRQKVLMSPHFFANNLTLPSFLVLYSNRRSKLDLYIYRKL